MKLTKKLESEILKVYNAYWDSYFKGDMRTFASLLHENVQLIGSSVNETFFSKKAALKFYKSTAGQVAGKAGVRNRKITMRPVDNNILVIEQSDFYALIDNEWSFYGNGRISTLLHKTNNGWKIIHEHGSLPDSKAGEGEQLNTEKIKAENIQLRDAIKRRTIELEQKNSELKVEASLERVRAVAMGMNESDDLLRICEVSFKEFQKLGFGNIRNAVIHILNDEKKVFLDYDYSDYLGGSINNIDYNSHPVVEDYLRQIKKADDAFAQVVIEGNELDGWKEFRRSSGQLDDPRLNETKALHYYLYSIGVGDIGISAFGPIDDSQIKILKRFRNVFDLAYKRYNDIALAEAQAKEAQIEAALERVRSRTMGMQKSEELKEVIRVVYEQFVNLKINVNHAGFVVDYTPKGDWHFWIADEQDIPSKITHPYFESVWANQFNEAKEKGSEFFATNLNFEEKNKFYNELLSYVPGLPDSSKDFYLSCPGLAGSTVLFDNVSLYIENFSGIPYSDEDNNTLMRFGKVFQQTYTRFNDLKQAEAQAKESQIEAALERVRSRTMAMHQSSELAETASVLFKQLIELGVEPNRLYIAIVKDETGKAEFWITDEDGSKVSSGFSAKLNDNSSFNKMFEGWKKKNKSLTMDMHGKELREYFEHLGKLNVPFKSGLSQKRRVQHIAYFSQGFIGIASPDLQSEETVNLLERFAAVFNLTYRRFLDLQKAEAQAREAQIELGLERVRARAMAMHKSEELLELVDTVFKELTKLDFTLKWCIINIIDESTMSNTVWAANPDINKTPESYHMLFEDYPFHDAMMKGYKERATKYIYVLEGIEKKVYDEYLFNETEFRKVPATAQAASRAMEKYVVTFSFSNFGGLQTVGEVPLSDTNIDILSRFGKVFDLTYTRFNDLKKAEVQAREAQIEAALERVRAKAMAMHTSNDLSDTMGVVFTELPKLGINSLRCGVVLLSKDSHRAVFYAAATTSESDSFSMIGTGNMAEHPEFVNQYEFWLRNENYFTTLSDEELRSYYEALFARLSVPYKPREHKVQTEHGYYFAFSAGMFYAWAETPYSKNEITILNRFKAIIDLTFRRYLDLQKAEAQAREAQIELALERVRARTMAMHKSEELSETAHELFQQFKEIDKEPKMLTIGIMNENEGLIEFWVTDWSGGGSKVDRKFNASIDEPILLNKIYTAWMERQKSIVIELSNEELLGWVKYRISLSGVPDKTDYSNSRGFVAAAFFSKGMLSISTYEPFSLETMLLLERFAGVFNLTYTRFLDLQKAEAQARESQIETNLERVRARTMAMHKSEELAEVVAHLFEQLYSLGIKTYRCNLGIVDESLDNIQYWATTNEGKVRPVAASIPISLNIHTNKMYEGWKNQRSIVVIKLLGKERLAWTESVSKYISFTEYQPENIDKEKILNEPAILSNFYFKQGFFAIHTLEELDSLSQNIISRFAKVFEQTYTRFQDLIKAEAQAREAKIEASLERVRSKAMAMHNTNDLSETVNVFFKELKTLGIVPIRCGVGQIDEATRTTSLTTTTSSQQGDSFQVIGQIKQTGHPVLDGIFDQWKLQKEYHPVLQGEDIKAYYDVMNAQIGYPEYPEGVTQYGNSFPFKEGFVFAWTANKLSEEELQIFRRFTSVLSLTYRRYMDLKAAEVRAIEAVKQASLDRVRAEIASMRTSEDLNHITPIIWRELKNLEVPFFRCGVYIVEEANSKVQVYLTTPDGKSLAVLDLTLDSNELTKNTVEYWRKQKVYKDHWNKEEFLNWTKLMIEQGQVKNAETYQGSVAPPDSLYLHFVPFKQGMLYVGDTSPLPDEKLQLVKSLAETFSIAYSRYEDFKNLENAKAKIEVTLNELRSAQAQLIHSEKMASLGELTAGIAHEIKNPLNFVNNFSEVSRELLDEMKTELQNKNLDEVIELIEDLKQNLDKINTHGKRADSIVKGMLLHSRGTSGEKTLTDINDLLDQYVNLAYHGMRAQNKEFNITIEKNYDDALEKINVVPQDISRVFLNIVNNACYAANEKKKNDSNDFSPLLKVSTKKLNDKVEIRIGDNGDGIPESIKKQIFNPFFTTKPTGEGTGLGLSLSYDIVTKVHGGDIKVESEDGRGAIFIIHLPLS